MFQNAIRRLPPPRDMARLSTEELRETFLIESLFEPGQITGTFTDLDRLVAGGVMPLQPVALPNHKETV